MIALYIILGISLIALVYLFIVVIRGGNKNTKSFQRELALRKAKNDSKQLAKDYVEGNITFDELSEKVYNKETLNRVKKNEERTAELIKENDELPSIIDELKNEADKLQKAYDNAKDNYNVVKASGSKEEIAKAIEEVRKAELDLKNKNKEIKDSSKKIKENESLIKQLKHDLRLIISDYSYGAQAGKESTNLTRSEKIEEKRIVKENMRIQRAKWKEEDEEYYARVKENIAIFKEQVKESEKVLKELEKAYKEEKKRNQAAEKLVEKEAKAALRKAKDLKRAYELEVAKTAKMVKNNLPEEEINAQKEIEENARLEAVEALKVAESYPQNKKAKKSDFIVIEDPLHEKGINIVEEEDDPNHVHEKAYREYLEKHVQIVQKYRIEKDRISLSRRLERWSKRGGRLRREIFVKRQYYYLVAPYTILFVVFTVIPVLMSLYFSFTYFNLLEPPTFIGWENYMRLFVDDKVFIIAIRNTAILAVITGPLSYLMAFLFAWLINELRPLARSIMTLIFYAPSISGNVYLVWKLIFSSDMYGYANSILLNLNIIDEPITWLQDANYIIWILIIVQLWMSLGVSFLSFIAGLQSVNRELYEAGAIDGIKNRWQELWYITLPQMKSQLLFGAVMQITSALSVAEVSTQIAGFPSIEYAGHTIITHLNDYGSIRMEMGYASAIATILFLIMILCNLLVRKVIRRVGS